MAGTFLLDEDTETHFAVLLAEEGYDVERVVAVDELGAGADDEAVQDYANRTDRIIVTYDDHHIAVPNNGVLAVGVVEQGASRRRFGRRRTSAGLVAMVMVELRPAWTTSVSTRGSSSSVERAPGR